MSASTGPTPASRQPVWPSVRDVIGSRRVVPGAAVLLVLAIGLAACSRPAAQAPGVGAAAPTASASTGAAAPSSAAALALGTPAPVVVIPAALRGTWTSNVQGTTATSGVWRLVASSNDLALGNPKPYSDPFPLNPTAITPTTFTLDVDHECPDQGVATEGKYTWAIAAGVLKISAVSDSCGDRQAVLVAGPWTKQP
jgi:hypothetical protein